MTAPTRRTAIHAGAISFIVSVVVLCAGVAPGQSGFRLSGRVTINSADAPAVYALVRLSPMAPGENSPPRVRVNPGSGRMGSGGEQGGITQQLSEPHASWTTTDERGQYSLAGLVGGYRYVVSVEIRGQLAYRGIVDIPYSGPFAIMLTTSDRAKTTVDVRLIEADDDAAVFINGAPIVRWSKDRDALRRVELHPGINPLEVRVFNQRSFTGGLRLFGGHRPEGWRCGITLQPSTGQPFTWQGAEDRPDENGPRFGKEFVALQARVHVAASGEIVVADVTEPWRR